MKYKNPLLQPLVIELDTLYQTLSKLSDETPSDKTHSSDIINHLTTYISLLNKAYSKPFTQGDDNVH